MINQFFLDYHDILFYIHSKTEREKASYTTNIIFNKKTVSELKLKATLFVNKCKNILDKNEKEQ